MKLTRAVCVAIGIGLSAPCLADELAPMMDPNRPVQCARDTEGWVWRVQCDERTRVCLYAPNDELDSENTRTTHPVERARECTIGAPFDRAKLEAAGYTMRPGRVDAPWGWMRDERGRVFQVDFDLHRRLYFGVAYSPRKILENPLESTRTSFDFGLFIAEWLHDGDAPGDSPTRHRLHLLEGQVHMQPFAADVTAFHYDVSHRYTDALLRITTFMGTPQRHDLFLDLGLWTEAGGLELRRTSLGDSQLWKHASAMVTLDLWQSDDLMSFLRFRTGGGLEGQHDDVNGYRSALTETSALDLDTVLDDHGYHNLRIELAHEVPRYFTPYRSDVFVQRFHARAQYETIVLAINDQPLTFRLAAGGEKRNDIPGIPDQWAFIVDAGLRFNLWAPPRPHS
jgi:hypothetical protein